MDVKTIKKLIIAALKFFSSEEMDIVYNFVNAIKQKNPVFCTLQITPNRTITFNYCELTRTIISSPVKVSDDVPELSQINKYVENPKIYTTKNKDIILDEIRHKVSIFNSAKKKYQEVILPLKEFNLLSFFMRNPGKFYPRSILMQGIGVNPEAYANIIDVYVKNLRKKLGYPTAKHIQTQPKLGYYFVDSLKD